MESIELEDKVMAMEFAFISLAKALQEQRALPISVLADHLRRAASQLHETDELAVVAQQVDALRGMLLQLQ